MRLLLACSGPSDKAYHFQHLDHPNPAQSRLPARTSRSRVTGRVALCVQQFAYKVQPQLLATMDQVGREPVCVSIRQESRIMPIRIACLAVMIRFFVWCRSFVSAGSLGWMKLVQSFQPRALKTWNTYMHSISKRKSKPTRVARQSYQSASFLIQIRCNSYHINFHLAHHHCLFSIYAHPTLVHHFFSCPLKFISTSSIQCTHLWE